MKSVLMIAFHYPPEGSSSGVQRTLTFSKYLREAGWEPIVLTVHPRAYPVSRNDQLADIPDDIVVRRAFALDSGRHLAFCGRYPRVAALPDRWVSWGVAATVRGWQLVRKHRPRILWSTYPIATAHLIGYGLQKLTGLPWVADFRDSMTEDGYPTDEKQWRAYRWIEQKTIGAATRAVFTTPNALRMYRDRYSEVTSPHFAVIPNGYDEPSFADAERGQRVNSRRAPVRPLVLLHSGVLYPSERDPRSFYAALAGLLLQGRISVSTVRIVLRNTGHDAHHRHLIESHGLDEIVTLAPRVAYRDALREMLEVDGLLILQASSCNHQVPAKIYEYLRSRKPILALTDPEGDTATVLRNAAIDTIAPLDDEQWIATELLRFLDGIRSGKAPIASDEEIGKHSRRARTEALASLLDEVAEGLH